MLHPDESDPLRATSFGTVEQIRIALDNNVNRIIIAMGGSGTVDGGAVILSALGIVFFDKEGKHLVDLPENLAQLATIDVSGLDGRIFNCEVIVLCDVDNLLLGEKGAAKIFGPQKGASPEAVTKLEASLVRFKVVALKQTGKVIAAIRYGGTAGGAAAGLYAFLDATLVNCIDYFLQLTNFEKALEKAHIVFTGEGSIDEQTLHGKGPFGVASKAKSKGIPVIAIAVKVPLLKDSGLQKYFDVLMAVGKSTC